MKLIKSVFLAGLVLVVFSAGIFAMYNRGAFNSLNVTAQANGLTSKLVAKLPPQISNLLPERMTATNSAGTTKSKISYDQDAAAEQIRILGERSEEVSAEIGKVLGDFVQVNEEGGDQALHEKALEYGQYLYCQQVVDQYKEKEIN